MSAASLGPCPPAAAPDPDPDPGPGGAGLRLSLVRVAGPGPSGGAAHLRAQIAAAAGMKKQLEAEGARLAGLCNALASEAGGRDMNLLALLAYGSGALPPAAHTRAVEAGVHGALAAHLTQPLRSMPHGVRATGGLAAGGDTPFAVTCMEASEATKNAPHGALHMSIERAPSALADARRALVAGMPAASPAARCAAFGGCAREEAARAERWLRGKQDAVEAGVYERFAREAFPCAVYALALTCKQALRWATSLGLLAPMREARATYSVPLLTTTLRLPGFAGRRVDEISSPYHEGGVGGYGKAGIYALANQMFGSLPQQVMRMVGLSRLGCDADGGSAWHRLRTGYELPAGYKRPPGSSETARPHARGANSAPNCGLRYHVDAALPAARRAAAFALGDCELSASVRASSWAAARTPFPGPGGPVPTVARAIAVGAPPRAGERPAPAPAVRCTAAVTYGGTTGWAAIVAREAPAAAGARVRLRTVREGEGGGGAVAELPFPWAAETLVVLSEAVEPAARGLDASAVLFTLFEQMQGLRDRYVGAADIGGAETVSLPVFRRLLGDKAPESELVNARYFCPGANGGLGNKLHQRPYGASSVEFRDMYHAGPLPARGSLFSLKTMASLLYTARWEEPARVWLALLDHASRFWAGPGAARPAAGGPPGPAGAAAGPARAAPAEVNGDYLALAVTFSELLRGCRCNMQGRDRDDPALDLDGLASGSANAAWRPAVPRVFYTVAVARAFQRGAAAARAVRGVSAAPSAMVAAWDAAFGALDSTEHGFSINTSAVALPRPAVRGLPLPLVREPEVCVEVRIGGHAVCLEAFVPRFVRCKEELAHPGQPDAVASVLVTVVEKLHRECDARLAAQYMSSLRAAGSGAYARYGRPGAGSGRATAPDVDLGLPRVGLARATVTSEPLPAMAAAPGGANLKAALVAEARVRGCHTRLPYAHHVGDTLHSLRLPLFRVVTLDRDALGTAGAEGAAARRPRRAAGAPRGFADDHTADAAVQRAATAADFEAARHMQSLRRARPRP
jgi:hypothetical protein